MTSLSLDTQLIRNPDFIAADMDGDTVMMGVECGKYYGIGGVGSRVWEALAQPVSFGVLVRTICAEYAIDEATCQTDLRLFIEALRQNGLVSTC